MDRRVHRLTPLIRGWTALVALALIAAVNFSGPLITWVRQEDFGFVHVVRGAGVLILGLALLVGLSQLWWARMGFGIGDEELGLKRGVITTQVRTARYDRIQAVDVVEPFAARIFGLAAVRVEVAGGNDSAIEIAYLPTAEAEQVRAEILRAVAREGTEVETAPDNSDYLVEPIPVRRTLVSTALQLSTLAAAVFTAIPLLTDLTLAAAVPVLLGVVPPIWRMVDQSWRFNSVRGQDILTVTYGLANRRRQAVPLDRIHAVSLSQPPLWRMLGWWEVKVNVAGYRTSGDGGTLTLLPVGTLEQALAVVRALSSLQVSSLHQIDPGTAEVDLRSPRRARLVSPIDWRRQSIALIDDVAVVTYGALSRRFIVVDTPHIQELTYAQGPLQRWQRLAHVRLDLVPGPVKAAARDLDQDHAREIVDTLRMRSLPELKPEPVTPRP